MTAGRALAATVRTTGAVVEGAVSTEIGPLFVAGIAVSVKRDTSASSRRWADRLLLYGSATLTNSRH